MFIFSLKASRKSVFYFTLNVDKTSGYVSYNVFLVFFILLTHCHVLYINTVTG